MNANALREAYFLQALGGDILAEPTAFYDAFSESEEALGEYFTALWETHCAHHGVTLSEHSFFPQVEPYVLEDTPEGFLALVTVGVAQTKTAAAMQAAIVFGSAMDPRVFAATPKTLKNGDTWAITECRESNRVDVAVLYQGCDNGMQLFDPPTPQKVDRDTPLAVARREAAFVDAVVCWCMDHD